jgi:epoxyqueuosine reductase
MKEKLIQQLEMHGYRASIVSVRRLKDLREAIESLYEQGLLEEEIYREQLAELAMRLPVDMPEVRSLISVARRDPQVRFSFSWDGTLASVIVPPTYLHSREKDKQAELVLADAMRPQGYRAAPVLVPKKLLAVCSGLARYGRNNIAYVEGIGSFYRLAPFCSDFPCELDEWEEPKMMECCEHCLACVESCPTRAIEPRRFLLHADRCITFRNEKPGQVAFPEWIDSSWHNCLIGCMHCQSACPENRDVVDWFEEGVEFSEEDTGLILRGVPRDGLPPALVEKLEHWDLLRYLDILPRNLKVLLDKRDE